MKTVFQFLALANAASTMQGRSLDERDRLDCAQANYMVLTGWDETSYPELPRPYTPWMMETVSVDEIYDRWHDLQNLPECRADNHVIYNCSCPDSGDSFWQFHEDEELCIFLIEDAPEAFWPEPEPGVARFSELICGEDVQEYVDEYANNDEHHWEDDDHHWDDYDHYWDDYAHYWENDDHHWEDDDHHWDDNDHDWDQNFHFAGADPMDAIGNMIGGLIGQELHNQRTEVTMICTSANYMSLAAANEKFPIPQVPLGPTLDWREIFGDLGDLDRLLGELPFEIPGGPMWRSNGNSLNFTFTPAMTDFRKQVLERAFGPDILNHPMGKKMMQPVVPKLMCAISEGAAYASRTRSCECSNRYDFKDEEFCRIIQSDDTSYAMEMIGYQAERDPAYHCMKSLVCGELDFETVEAGTPCGFLINGLSFGIFILCAILKF